MEITGILELIVGIAIVILGVGISFLAAFCVERSAMLSLIVFAIGLMIMGLLARSIRGSDIIVIYQDNSTKRETWKDSFVDFSGERYQIENGKAYVFFDCLGDEDVPDIELTVFNVYYTSYEDKIGEPVENAGPAIEITLCPHQLQTIPWIHYSFKKIPNSRTTGECSNYLTLRCLDFTSVVGTDYKPYYRALYYEPTPEYY